MDPHLRGDDNNTLSDVSVIPDLSVIPAQAGIYIPNQNDTK